MIAEHTKRIAVVGLGNLLMSDDGVGVHVIRELQKKPLDGVELIDAGTSVIHAADCLHGMDCIVVVDALQAGHEPGTVYSMSGSDILENDYRLSIHSMGLKTALTFLMPDEIPDSWMVVGVEPETLELGIGLSQSVECAVPGAVRTVEQLIEEWGV